MLLTSDEQIQNEDAQGATIDTKVMLLWQFRGYNSIFSLTQDNMYAELESALAWLLAR
jgi:hypothetical protein